MINRLFVKGEDGKALEIPLGEKKPQSITLSDSKVTLTPSNTSATVTITAAGPLSVESADASLCTVSLDDNVMTVTANNLSADAETSVSITAKAVAEYNEVTVALRVIIKASYIVGVEWDGNSSPAFSRTDEATYFMDPVVESMKLHNASGTYPDGQSPFDNISPWKDMEIVEDEQAGTLVKIPKFYYKWTRNGTAMKLQISMKQENGFLCSPAHMDRGDGYGERDVVYVGRYHCAESTFKSTTDSVMAQNYTRSEFRTNIHALGNEIWQWDFAMLWTIRMLFLVEFASWDCAGKIGFGTWTPDYGITDHTGVTDVAKYHTSCTSHRVGNGRIQYRNIEDLWGMVYDFVDGISLGSSYYVTQFNPSEYNDSASGNTLPMASSTGNASKFISPGEDKYKWALMPSEVVSDTNYGTYICARYIYNAYGGYPAAHTGSNTSWGNGMGLMWINGVQAAAKNTFYGSRLMKLPNN